LTLSLFKQNLPSKEKKNNQVRNEESKTVRLTSHRTEQRYRYHSPDRRDKRVIMRNLVYLIGLPYHLATIEHIQSREFFGQFGIIRKIIINRDKGYSNRGYQSQTCSAYITFESDIGATMAILGIDGAKWHKRFLKASFGMTKFCSYFLNGQKCPKEKCLFLHREAESGDVVTIKDKTTQRVHVRVTRENVIDFCLGLGAQTILDYERWILERDNNVSQEDSFDEYDFEIEGIISVEEVLENIKQEFRKKHGVSLAEWIQKEKENRVKKQMIKKKKKKRKKKTKRSKQVKKVIGKW
jgi:hypothetical protein